MISELLRKKLPTTINLLENQVIINDFLTKEEDECLIVNCITGKEHDETPIYAFLKISPEHGFFVSVGGKTLSNTKLGFSFSIQGVIEALNKDKEIAKYLDQDYIDLFISLTSLCRYAFVNDTNRKRPTETNILQTIIGNTTLEQLINKKALDESRLLSLGYSVIAGLAAVRNIPTEVKLLLWNTGRIFIQSELLTNSDATSCFNDMAFESGDETLLLILKKRNYLPRPQYLN
jgi:hypothetical protein